MEISGLKRKVNMEKNRFEFEYQSSPNLEILGINALRETYELL